MTIQGSLRVWWIPQVGMDGEPFRVDVADTDEAIKVMDLLGQYDAYQFESNIKPDYCNVGGLEVFEDGEWIDWESDDGDTIDDIRMDKRWHEYHSRESAQ